MEAHRRELRDATKRAVDRATTTVAHLLDRETWSDSAIAAERITYAEIHEAVDTVTRIVNFYEAMLLDTTTAFDTFLMTPWELRLHDPMDHRGRLPRALHSLTGTVGPMLTTGSRISASAAGFGVDRPASQRIGHGGRCPSRPRPARALTPWAGLDVVGLTVEQLIARLQESAPSKGGSPLLAEDAATRGQGGSKRRERQPARPVRSGPE